MDCDNPIKLDITKKACAVQDAVVYIHSTEFEELHECSIGLNDAEARELHYFFVRHLWKNKRLPDYFISYELWKITGFRLPCYLMVKFGYVYTAYGRYRTIWYVGATWSTFSRVLHESFWTYAADLGVFHYRDSTLWEIITALAFRMDAELHEHASEMMWHHDRCGTNRVHRNSHNIPTDLHTRRTVGAYTQDNRLFDAVDTAFALRTRTCDLPCDECINSFVCGQPTRLYGSTPYSRFVYRFRQLYIRALRDASHRCNKFV